MGNCDPGVAKCPTAMDYHAAQLTSPPAQLHHLELQSVAYAFEGLTVQPARSTLPGWSFRTDLRRGGSDRRLCCWHDQEPRLPRKGNPARQVDRPETPNSTVPARRATDAVGTPRRRRQEGTPVAVTVKFGVSFPKADSHRIIRRPAGVSELVDGLRQRMDAENSEHANVEHCTR